MNEYFVFLRGINVGGNKKVPMGDLKKLLLNNGFTEISTYLNSGNIRLMTTENDAGNLEQTIESLISGHFGFAVPVICREGKRMDKLFKQSPFGGNEEDKKIKWMVTFLKTPVDTHPEIETFEGYDITFRAPDLIGGILDLNKTGSVDAMQVLDKAYGREITTRTWQTLIRMNTR